MISKTKYFLGCYENKKAFFCSSKVKGKICEIKLKLIKFKKHLEIEYIITDYGWILIKYSYFYQYLYLRGCVLK